MATSGEAVVSYRTALLLSAMLPVCGNLTHVAALRHRSLLLAFIGRFLVGFGSSDIVNRKIVSRCVLRGQIVRESARLSLFRTRGLITGPIIGVVFHSVVQNGADDINQSLLMDGIHLSVLLCFLWAAQFTAVAIFFREPYCIRRYVGGSATMARSKRVHQTTEVIVAQGDSELDLGYFTESRVEKSLMHRDSSDVATDIKSAFDGSMAHGTAIKESDHVHSEPAERRSAWSRLRRVMMLVCYNIALPVALANIGE